METFTFPQFSPERSTVQAALYTNVTNAGALRKRIVGAAGMKGEEGEREREAVNFAFIDARLITSRLHLQTAVYQAILAESQNLLRTRTVHSEVLWALNPTNNITEALRRYGVSDKTTSVMVVGIDGGSAEKMGAVVTGTLSPFATLDMVTDWAAVKKYHKLEKGGNAAVANVVVSTVATKSVM